MSRFKKRIDYASWSVDIFSNDTKIDKLLDAQGWKGFGVYFFLCQMAFSGEGYFYEWCYDLCASTARKMGGGMGAETVENAVRTCLQIGLFDKRLFEEWGILTSRGIQKSYLVVLSSKNRTGTQIYKEFWLLDINEDIKKYRGVIFVPKNGENDTKLGENTEKLIGNDGLLRQKESKGKESKGKESIVYPPISPGETFEKFWDVYPNKRCRAMAEKEYCDILLEGKTTESELLKAAENYAEYCMIKETDKIYNPNNFIGKMYFVDYLPENYQKPEKRKPSNKFNNFNQRRYDYDALEQQLLGGGAAHGK